MKRVLLFAAFAVAGLLATDKKEKIKVHIVPHSYNPDFLWNIDIYFPGMKDELT